MKASATSSEQIFGGLYNRDAWHGGSGKGSFPRHTQGYRKFLQEFLTKHPIRRVLDLGCGDWQFSRHVDWTGIEYLGLDVVPDVIAANQQAFAGPNIRFQQKDFAKADLPEADLVVVKDVLQHWPNDWVLEFLPKLECFPFALITNCIRPSKNKQVNQDINLGNFRPLDLRRPPFDRKWPILYRFAHTKGTWPFRRTKWQKAVFLYTHP